MPLPNSPQSFSDNIDTVAASTTNANNQLWYNTLTNYVVFTDVAKTISALHTFTGGATFSGGTVNFSGATVTNLTAAGTFTGALVAPDGTVGTPAIRFTNDPDCGLYRIGLNNIGVALNGAKVGDWSTSGLGITGALTVSGGTTSYLVLATDTGAAGRIYKTAGSGTVIYSAAGSVLDFALTNSAGTTVCSVPTGTTGMTFAGTVTATAFSGPLTGNVTGNVSGTAPAGTLTGATLASNVLASSLTSVGTLAALTVTATITGSVSGNAATATKLFTARTINGVAFDGSANIIVSAGTVGTLTFGTYLQAGDASFSGSAATISTNATAANTASTLVARNSSGDFAAGTITAALTGNALTASTLVTTRTIWGQNFNGSADVSGAFSGATTGSFSDDVTLATTKGLVWGGRRLLNYNTSTSTLFIGEAGSGATSLSFPVGGIVGMTLSTTGVLAVASNVTGGTYNGQTISATANFTGTVGVAADLTLTGAAARMNVYSSTGTSAAFLDYQNTGGHAYVGLENSVGNALVTSGGVAYALALVSPSAKPVLIAPAGTVAATFAASGAVTLVAGLTVSAGTTAVQALTATTATMSGLITASAGMLVNGGSFATGRLYKDATFGTALAGQTGSNGDLALLAADGTDVVVIPTGTTTLSVRRATTFSSTIAATGAINTDSTTDSTSTTTGSIQTDGGLGVAKAIVCGTTLTANKLKGGGSAPGVAAGAGAGSSPTISISGTDTAGKVTLSTGLGATGGDLAVITFATAYAATPSSVVLTPATSAAANALGLVTALSTTGFTIDSLNEVVGASQALNWYYMVIA